MDFDPAKIDPHPALGGWIIRTFWREFLTEPPISGGVWSVEWVEVWGICQNFRAARPGSTVRLGRPPTPPDPPSFVGRRVGRKHKHCSYPLKAMTPRRNCHYISDIASALYLLLRDVHLSPVVNGSRIFPPLLRYYPPINVRKHSGASGQVFH